MIPAVLTHYGFFRNQAWLLSVVNGFIIKQSGLSFSLLIYVQDVEAPIPQKIFSRTLRFFAHTLIFASQALHQDRLGFFYLNVEPIALVNGTSYFCKAPF